LRDEELDYVALESEEDPSALLARVPLRDPLSDLNWKKFAGESLEKIYKVKERDTLWAISERLFGNPYLGP
jgi:hypothetical protein